MKPSEFLRIKEELNREGITPFISKGRLLFELDAEFISRKEVEAMIDEEINKGKAKRKEMGVMGELNTPHINGAIMILMHLKKKLLKGGK